MVLSSGNGHLRRDATRETVQSREKELVDNFSTYVSYYDRHLPFTAHGQLEYHRWTIDRRRELGSVRAAVLDEEFVKGLWRTLDAWGMNSRAARLLPSDGLSTNLRKNLSTLEALEVYHIDDTMLGDEEKVNRIWNVISEIQVTESENRVVSGTKMLHHLLPDLVPPMDRQYTRKFFQWYTPQFQDNPREVFLDMYVRFSRIARRTNPAQYVGEGWRTSKTKVLDNAVVAYCLMRKIRVA
jgi:hypothetical protein